MKEKKIKGYSFNDIEGHEQLRMLKINWLTEKISYSYKGYGYIYGIRNNHCSLR